MVLSYFMTNTGAMALSLSSSMVYTDVSSASRAETLGKLSETLLFRLERQQALL